MLKFGPRTQPCRRSYHFGVIGMEVTGLQARDIA